MKKISIIVPVYNGATYIERCIYSVVHQKGIRQTELELLIFDDGSTDDSLHILNRLKLEHPDLITLQSHKNRGVAETRNAGIDNARGKYILFLDQDDYFDDDYCQTLYDAAELGKYDVVICGKKRPDNNGKIIAKDMYKDADFTRFMSVSVWAKIHKTSFLQKEHIRIFDNHQGEDIVFSFEEAQKTKKIKTIEYCGYNWFYNSSSVSNSTQRGLDAENVQSILNVQNALIRLDTEQSRKSEFFIFMMSAYYLFFAGRASTVEQFLQARTILMEGMKKAYPRYRSNRYIWFSPKGTLPIFAVGVKLFTILDQLRLLPVFARLYCRR